MFGKKEKKNNDPNKLGFGRLALWQSRAISTSIAVLVGAYLMIYSTDTLQIPAAMVSILLVASKLVDGVTDMLAGLIVDRTETKWGKGRPYEVFIVGIWFFTWLMFTCPTEFSTPIKAAWIFITYTMVNSICLTFLNANNATYMVRAFDKQEHYINISSYGSIFTMLAAIIFNIIAPILVSNIATNASGWSFLVACIAIPMTIIGLLRVLFIPEIRKIGDSQESTEKVNIKDVVKLIKYNKYILYLSLANFVFSFVANMGIAVYYFTYVVGNLGLAGITAATQIILMPIAFILPGLIKKFSVGGVVKYGFFISALGYLVNYFAGSNVPLLVIGAILTGGGTIPISMLIALLVIDNADYNEFKGGQRMEGTMSSIVSFASKVGAAAGTGILGVLLSMSGYTGNINTTPDSSITMIQMLYSLIPMALYLLCMLTMNLYKLDKEMPQIRASLEEKRAFTQSE